MSRELQVTSLDSSTTSYYNIILYTERNTKWIVSHFEIVFYFALLYRQV